MLKYLKIVLGFAAAFLAAALLLVGLLFIVVLIAEPAQAQERRLDLSVTKWSKQDDALHAVYLWLRVVDTKQTVDCMKNRPGCMEVGDIAVMMYGNYPTEREIYKYTALHITVVTLGAMLLDPPYRTVLQSLMIFDEGRAVYANRDCCSSVPFGPTAAVAMTGLMFKWTFF